MNRIRTLGVLLFGLALLSACGYNLVGRGTFLPKEIKTISIPIFQNTTPEPNLENDVSNQIRQKFITDGRLKVVEDSGQLLLTGKIISYNLQPVAYDANNNVSEYLILMDFHVVLTNRAKNEQMLDQTFNTKWHYKVSTEITDSESQRRDAIREASIDAAERMVSLVIEGF